MSDVIELSKQLINLASVTPEGAACIDLIAKRLAALNFSIEKIPCAEATNLWARYGTTQPLLCFLGHVDVVPPGDLSQWNTPPFGADIRDGYLYGRGASDMKTGVAASVVAIEQFLAQHPDFSGSIALLLTSAEEEMDELGTPRVIDALQARGEHIDYCITTEPSSSKHVGDTIRVGRRGSLSGQLTIHGIQGHVAYPKLAKNPIHQALAALDELAKTRWDQGNKHFPATSFQFTNIHAGDGATNVIPAQLGVQFNFRFCPESSVDSLKQKTESVLAQHQLDYSIRWHCSGQPFYTPSGQLLEATIAAIESITHQTPTLSTGGGTSDARFIAPLGTEVVELGVSNQTAHKINECVKITDIEQLSKIYGIILANLLTK